MKTKQKKKTKAIMKKKDFKQLDLRQLEESSVVTIGDLSLGSDTAEVNQLCSLAVWLLQQKEVKQYLQERSIRKKRDGMGTYIE